MEITVENGKNEEDNGYLNLFHKGDVILYGGRYCLIKEIDEDDNAVPLRINNLDDSDECQNRWINLPEHPEEEYVVGVSLFPASQYHLSIVKNDN